ASPSYSLRRDLTVGECSVTAWSSVGIGCLSHPIIKKTRSHGTTAKRVGSAKRLRSAKDLPFSSSRVGRGPGRSSLDRAEQHPMPSHRWQGRPTDCSTLSSNPMMEAAEAPSPSQGNSQRQPPLGPKPARTDFMRKECLASFERLRVGDALTITEE